MPARTDGPRWLATVDAVEEVALNVKLPRELHARMKSRAAMRGRTIRQYVAEAIAEIVERDENQDRETGRG
jgi:predicted DNA-binding protein